MRWIGIAGWILLFAAAVFAESNNGMASKLRADLDERYGSVEQSPLNTGILYDLVAPLSGLSVYDGSVSSPALDVGTWRQIAHELKRASLIEWGLPAHSEFREIGRTYARERIFPIAVLNYRYQKIRPGLTAEDAWRFENDRFVSVNPAAFEEKPVFAVSALAAETRRGSHVPFRIDRDTFFFSNVKSSIIHLQVDFDDGDGFRLIAADGDIIVNYKSVGVKTIRLRAVQSDGIILNGSFRFDVRSLDTPNPTEIWPIQAAISHNGVFAGGEAYIYLSDQHATLTKPVVVVEGLDLDNTLGWDELYELLNQENMIEDLRALGYDAIVLNYTESTTYVQANAYLVAELLDQVQQAVGDSTTLALVGASMGGLTCRYALTYMEANSLPHRVRTFVSFDAPHNGANIPLGVQYWVDFFSIESADAGFLRDALNTPAPRQMLLTHFTDPAVSTASPDPLFAVLNADLAALGDYPALPRLVAIANGSGTMQNAGFNPGDQLLFYEYYSFLVDIKGNVWALNNAQSQRIFQGVIDRIWPLSDDALSVTVAAAPSWDNAPGGLRSTLLQMDTTEAPYGDIIALHSDHCFIPTISSLALAVSDPFYNISGDPNLGSLSPFDTLYYPAANQEHVLITPENYEWFIREICEPLPPPTVVVFGGDGTPRLTWNPVSGAASYRVYTTDSWDVWPGQYVETADTTWTDPDPSAGMRFYRVAASTSSIP